MLPCPAGTFCPLSTPSQLFASHSLQTRFEQTDEDVWCAPYGYQAARTSKGEIVCGGANTWPREPRSLRWSIASISTAATPPAAAGHGSGRDTRSRQRTFGDTVREVLETSVPGDSTDNCVARITEMGSSFCPPGFYCADAKSIVACPRHHRCDPGSTAPQKCGVFDICGHRCGDATTSHAITGAVIVALVTIVTIFVAFIMRRRMMLRQRGSSRHQLIQSRRRSRLRVVRSGSAWLFRRLSGGIRVEASDLDTDSERGDTCEVDDDSDVDDASDLDCVRRSMTTEMVFLGEEEDAHDEEDSVRGSIDNDPGVRHRRHEEDVPEEPVAAIEPNAQRRVRPISITFTRLTVSIRPSMKRILGDVTGSFRSGTFPGHLMGSTHQDTNRQSLCLLFASRMSRACESSGLRQPQHNRQ